MLSKWKLLMNPERTISLERILRGMSITASALSGIISPFSSSPMTGKKLSISRIWRLRVAVKNSAGKSNQSNHHRPEFTKDLVQMVGGNIVECDTTYGEIVAMDIMDKMCMMNFPVVDTKHLQHDIVGSHLANYDFMIDLAHFNGHAMGGFDSVLKKAGHQLGLALEQVLHPFARYDLDLQAQCCTERLFGFDGCGSPCRAQLLQTGGKIHHLYQRDVQPFG